jgi:hypothetical protein
MEMLKYENNQKKYREANKEKIAKRQKEQRRCKQDGCTKWESVRGFCMSHYRQMIARGDARLASKVESNPELERRASEYAKELVDDGGYSSGDAISRARAAYGLEPERKFEVTPRMNAIEFMKRSDHEPFGAG